MWRYLVGAAGGLCLTLAGMFLYSGAASDPDPVPPPPTPVAREAAPEPEPLPVEVPKATEKTREEKRFDRYDRDRDELITREEYLRLRRRAYAKLDTNGDGRLSFEEWAIKTTTRFADADANRNGTLTRAEFVKTRTRSSTPKPRSSPACRCPAGGDDDD